MCACIVLFLLQKVHIKMSSPYFSRSSTRNAAAKALAAFGSIGKKSTAAAVERSVASSKERHADEKPVKVKLENEILINDIDKSNSDNLTSVGFKVKQEHTYASKRKIKSSKIVSPKKERVDNDEDAIIKWEPPNWREVLKNIRLMRQNEDAPVDSQGCERTADEHESPEIIRYQILISLMLSAQTKDQVTFAAMEKLKKYGLTPQHIVDTDEKTIGELVYPVGFWKRKAKFIKQASGICIEKYKGDIPDSLEGLLALPGVGPKMAHICMHAAWNKMTGIGVDTHVHRISNRLGWVKKTTKIPEDTRKALESWLPREEWESLNVLFVGFGQQTCLPVRPKCANCLVQKMCPFGRSADKKPNKLIVKKEDA